MYKDCLENICIISPTIHIDKSWERVRKYITDKLKMNPEKETGFMETQGQLKVDEIVEAQEKVSDYISFLFF